MAGRAMGVCALTVVLLAMAALGHPARADAAGANETAADLRSFVRQTWQSGDGLPQNSVRDIVQTRDGYIWLATGEGLVRFDGARFVVFDRQSTPALPSNNISALFEARDGALWIALRRSGLARLSHGIIQTWPGRDGLSGQLVTDVIETQDGAIWAGTAGGGLARLKEGAVRVYRADDGLPGEFVTDLSEGLDGSLWIATDRGLARFADGRFTTLTSKDGLPHDTVRAVLHARGGSVLIGTAAGLARLDSDRIVRLEEGRQDDILSLAESADGSIWIGTRASGVRRVGGGTVSSLGTADGLPDDSVTALLEDSEGNMWVGQNAGGVTRLRASPFQTLNRRDGLPSDFVRAVLEAHDGSLWVATNGFGVAHVSGGRVTTLRARDGLPSDSVSALGQSSDGAIWIGTSDGLARLHDGRIRRYTARDGLPHDNVRAFLEDSHGQIWIGTYEGVCRIDGVRCVPVPGLNTLVRGFMEDRAGAIWTAGHDGIHRYLDGHITSWTKREGLSSDFVTSIALDEDGVIWAGTGDGGLNRLERGRVTTYRVHDGLFDDVVFRALPDGHGWMWMTSNRGLFRVSRKQLDAFAAGRTTSIQSLVYTSADGLPSSEFNGGAFPAGVVTRDGDLLLPSIKGVVRVSPGAFVSPPRALAAVIEEARVDDRPIEPAHGIRAAPGAERLEIQYSAPSFVAPEKIRFRYRLQGFDRAWIDAGSRRVAYYTNLPPGRYRFEVMASTAPGDWSGERAGVAVELEPRFYQTAWFAGGVAVALALAAWGAGCLRTRRTRANERRLETLVALRTRELQEEIAERRRAEAALVVAREAALSASRLKSEFLANVSHEIRTPMNGVLGMTDLVLEDGRLPGDVRACLETVRSSADALLHVINDILDFSKIEAGKLDLTPAGFALRELLDQIVSLFRPRAEEKGIRLEHVVDPRVPDALVADAGRIRQVLINLVGNALKFTERGSVRVVVEPGGDASTGALPLRFSVIDTGIGIAPEHQTHVFEPFTQVDGSSARRFGGTGLGLTISARLAQLMGGTVTVTSQVGEGSTFTFVVPVVVTGATAERSATGPVAPRCARPLRVLLAEDNPVNQTVAARILQKAGHAVTIVESGTAAVDAVAREPFDVVMMDLQMPGMNGFEATAAIRARECGGRVPIIALTAHAMPGDRARCLEAGMDGYVSKPVRAADLHAVLAELVPAA